jgi:hypothetical protein
MKKQINPTIKAHLIRGAFYLLLLLAVCAIPFALAQSRSRGTAAAAAKSDGAAKTNQQHAAPPSSGAVGALAIAARDQSHLPKVSSGPIGVPSFRMPPAPKVPQVVLYDQYNNASTTGSLSATFTDFPTFSSDLADDFVVPAGQTWNVQSIDADGVYFNGAGPATSWNVFIYTNSGGLPGTQVYSTLNQAVTQVGTTFTVNLAPAAVLAAGTYWIEIQANMTFGTQGEWGWTDRTVLSNNPAAFQNPGGGLGVCMTWMPKQAVCIPTAGGPDQVYRINGTTGGGGTPSPTPTASPTPTPTATGTPACIVVNGGFETGSLPPWVDTGDTSFTGVGAPAIPHSGAFALFSGPSTSDGFVDQVLPTVAGQAYDVTFWLQNVDTSSTNRFGASFGTVTLVPEAVQSAFGYTQFTFPNVIPGANADLIFTFYNPPSYFYLDDVCVTPSGGGGTPTPTPTASPSCTPSGSKIYNIAGFNLGGQSTTTRIYDIATNTWTTGAPIPEANGLSDHATGYWNGKIYVAGGFDGVGATNAARAYDIATDSWTSIAPLPAALYLPGFGVINGKFYVASGNNGSSEVNTLYIYDTATNTWTTGPVVPTPVTAPGSAVYQGKLYLFGGGAPFPTTITTTQIYDPVANSWSTGPSMNVGRVWFYGGSINDTSLVAPGGDNPPGIEINDNEQLTASWAIKAPLPFVSRGPFAVSDGTFVYIGGGYDGATVHADLLRYDPVANSYTPMAPSSDPHFLSQAVLVPGGAPCNTPTATPTATVTSTVTPTATATATHTPTATPTATVTSTVTPTATATATATVSVSPRPTPTPRPRPTPPPRP